MKLTHQAPKGQRINRFHSFTCEGYKWWFSFCENRWVELSDWGNSEMSSHQPCKSIRAFRRKLKKAPKGVKFTLVSEFIGHDVTGFGEKE